MIYNTIHEHEFARWIAQSDSYKNNFTWKGANALQQYLEELSDDIGENIEFDPVAWCVEYSEYTDYAEFQHDTGYTKDGKQYDGYENIKNIEDLRDYTTVIEFDGGIIVQEF
jgi:hypothetical protein